MARKRPKGHSNFDQLDRARRVLELPEVVSFADIQAAYYQQSRRWHPDHHDADPDDDCKRRMQEVNEAYAMLKKYFFLRPVSLRMEDLSEPLDVDEWWWNRFGNVFGQRRDDGG
jgi:hypothetical protein